VYGCNCRLRCCGRTCQQPHSSGPVACRATSNRSQNGYVAAPGARPSSARRGPGSPGSACSCSAVATSNRSRCCIRRERQSAGQPCGYVHLPTDARERFAGERPCISCTCPCESCLSCREVESVRRIRSATDGSPPDRLVMCPRPQRESQTRCRNCRFMRRHGLRRTVKTPVFSRRLYSMSGTPTLAGYGRPLESISYRPRSDAVCSVRACSVSRARSNRNWSARVMTETEEPPR
jgi:hypothetical protein